MFSDTHVSTAHMLKKCVIVPSKSLKKGRANSSFKRGAMQFEDFNYDVFNPYILIDEETGDKDMRYEPKALEKSELKSICLPQYEHDELLATEKKNGQESSRAGDDPQKLLSKKLQKKISSHVQHGGAQDLRGESDDDQDNSLQVYFTEKQIREIQSS